MGFMGSYGCFSGRLVELLLGTENELYGQIKSFKVITDINTTVITSDFISYLFIYKLFI